MLCLLKDAMPNHPQGQQWSSAYFQYVNVLNNEIIHTWADDPMDGEIIC